MSTDPPLAGSMGGYYTLKEVASEMERLAVAYPSWISKPIVIGTSHRGHPIQAYCIASDISLCYDDASSSGRATVMLTALVHSREPVTVMCLVHAIRELLAGAMRGESRSVHLLNTRKVLVLPVANPDGYLFNEEYRSHGGGMKRKNGLHTCSSPRLENDGVDLNRNFGFKYAYSNDGSSGNGCSEEYRGKGAFSEPESKAIRDVVAKHKPKALLHWHGWGNDIAFPYSYDWHAPLAASDLSLFQEFATEMAISNGYASGRAWESVGYTTNGEADDWGWGDMGVVSLTVEVGSSKDGFWPSPSRVLPLARENLWPAHYLMWAVGAHLQIHAVKIRGASDLASAKLELKLENNGLLGFGHSHTVCITAAEGSAGRTLGASCAPLYRMEARAITDLPVVDLELTPGAKSIELDIQVSPLTGDAGAHAFTFSFHLSIANDKSTLLDCDAKCMCNMVDESKVGYSAACRSTITTGSSCGSPKEAASGTNYASGVLDEYFSYVASDYEVGGRCTVISHQRDTLIAVYSQCGRFGPLSPVGFANSENGRTASVSFPCTAGSEFYMFWNAEYLPGRHAFYVTESCAGSCRRAHRSRHQRRLKRRIM